MCQLISFSPCIAWRLCRLLCRAASHEMHLSNRATVLGATRERTDSLGRVDFQRMIHGHRRKSLGIWTLEVAKCQQRLCSGAMSTMRTPTPAKTRHCICVVLTKFTIHRLLIMDDIYRSGILDAINSYNYKPQHFLGDK